MQSKVLQKIAEYLKAHRIRQKWRTVVTCLAAVVVFCTTYALILPAITLEIENSTGQRTQTGAFATSGDALEQIKSDKSSLATSSNVWKEESSGEESDGIELEYDLEATPSDASLSDATPGDASPSDALLSDATPSDASPSDAELDNDLLATSSNASYWWDEWWGALPDAMTGNWAEDLLAVAESQVGFEEQIDGVSTVRSGSIRGYTPYGEWYGKPYSDWDAMFVAFCLDYAEIPEEAVPQANDAQEWLETLVQEEWGLYADAAEYSPNPGDLIFLDSDGDGEADRIGIVKEYDEASLVAIEGDVSGETAKARILSLAQKLTASVSTPSNAVKAYSTALTLLEYETVEEEQSQEADQVQYVVYESDDEAIVGYAMLPENTAMLAAADTGYEQLAKFRLWQWVKTSRDSGTVQVGNYDNGAELTDVLRISDTNQCLIPIRYFTENYAGYGFTFDEEDPGDCPFVYAPSAYYPDSNLTNASYVQVDGEWYVQVEDTTGLTDVYRCNVYYKKYTIGTVQEAANHPSSVINLFDFWLTGRYDADRPNPDNVNSVGINEDHVLKFTTGGSGYNAWTGSELPYQGIVQNTLGSDGYPLLSREVTGSTESLAYLFDPDPEKDHEGKASYRNVSGLLQIDNSGYYYYDSQENFAEYDEDANRFVLYDTWGVYAGGQSPNGQFFPFNSMAEAADMKSTDTPINHYLGMTLTSRFTQQYDGHTTAGRSESTKFEFKGDDDVWIFIDNVLVADLGGIHNAASVEIDFSTGEISINADADNSSVKINTTLREAFKAADKLNSVEWNENNPEIFADHTYHTLKFYYLERGNTDSNLYLKYNLTEIPSTGIFKVNQYGEPVPGAVFAVYAAEYDAATGTYKYLSDLGGEVVELNDIEFDYKEGTGDIVDANGNALVKALYVGETDTEGEMVFVDDDRMPYSLNELEELFGEYFILKEIKVPEGYRLVSDEIYLHIDGNVLLCSNTYESGVYSAPTLLVTAPNTLKTAMPSVKEVLYYEPGKDTLETNGTLFAVVLKYSGDGSNLSNESDWAPVYGNNEKGYSLMEVSKGHFVEAAIKAAKAAVEYGDVVFSVSSSGTMQLEMTNLPGDITTYYHMLDGESKAETKYTVAYYWTSADSLEDADEDNTWRVDAEDETYVFDRAFGATIEVPNLTNRLFAQKFNEEGDLLNGAAFALYEVEEVSDGESSTIYYLDQNGTRIFLDSDTDADNEGTASAEGDPESYIYQVDSQSGYIYVGIMDEITGTLSIRYTISPYQYRKTLSAEDEQNEANEDGTAIFGGMSDGNYYLREIAAPYGYALNTTEVMIKVQEDAVYANAGTVDDGVTVARGPGYLVATLSKFASEGDIDNTLSWIYERMMVKKSDSFSAYESKEGWKYLTENNSDKLSEKEEDVLITYLLYEPKNEGALFNYIVNEGRYPEDVDVSQIRRRLYTPVGWSYYEIYQDYEYGSEVSGAHYDDLQGMDIAHLFSRSVYVQVTDERNPDLVIRKVDMLSPDRVLSGAKFVLYYEEGGTKYYYSYEKPGNSDETEIGTTNWLLLSEGTSLTDYALTTGKNGEITFCNISDGSYYLEEIAAPDGYYPLTSPIAITVSEGKMVSREGIQVSEDGLTLTIPNSTGYELPSTGGTGTLLYAISGSLLMAGSLLYWIDKRQRKGAA